MTEHKTIHAAFVAAKREFGPALKTNNNPAFRSKYADLGACLEAVDEALLNNGIALIQETSEDDTGVTVETVFIHESGQERRCGKLHVPASKQDPQGYGSALTYARRYSVMAACGIAPEDDDGNAASNRAPKPPPAPMSPPIDKKSQDEALDGLRAAARLGSEALKSEFSVMQRKASEKGPGAVEWFASLWKEHSAALKQDAAKCDTEPQK